MRVADKAVSIILLNWNGLADTVECLESLMSLDYPAYEVVVVDNGSTDGSAGVIRARFPWVVLIETGENLGFAGGNNVGLRHVMAGAADYAFLLNNDTAIDPLCIRQLVEIAEGDSAIGIVGPTIYYYHDSERVWSGGGAIDWQRGLTRMLGLDEEDVGQFGSAPREVDFVSGCAMLVRRAALERAGLMDERFFAYYEEVEWCVRIRQAGFRVVHVPQARLWHKITPECRADSPLVHYYMTRNRLLFLKASGAGWRAWVHTLLAEYLRTLISWSWRRRWRHRREQRRMMVQAIGDACRGRWGERASV